MLANRAIVVTNTTFSWSSWVFPLPFFYGHSKLKWPFGPTLFVFQVLLHSLCAYSYYVLKHIILRSISLFWLLFKSLFSFCLNKMVRSIIVKGGVSRERVVVKDSNDWSRLPGHWSRSVILTFTATHSLTIFPILSKCWDTLVPSCILLGKNRCRRHWMFTIVTESYILCRVSHLSHADSMSPKETSTLSLTTISSFEELFFLLSKTIDAAHMLSFVVRLQQHHLIEEAISARSAGLSFINNEKKKDPVLWEATAFSSSKPTYRPERERAVWLAI